MATILTLSTVDVNEQQKRAFVQALHHELRPLFVGNPSVIFRTVSGEYASGPAKDSISVNVLRPPNVPLEQKRGIARILHQTAQLHFGLTKQVRTAVHFWYHGAPDVGRSGIFDA
ncbi:MAG: hypothetical protein LBS56_00345 [Propionibacteriaceae bacterium]|jgi:hypothetical protein|nr:hypothetical protein [Propionibacteriaceae bacterium]